MPAKKFKRMSRLMFALEILLYVIITAGIIMVMNFA
jgi:hypothetical protein